MKTLIVGGEGRFGSWFARLCREKLGDEVTICDRANEGDLPALAAAAEVAILSVPLPLAPAIGARLASAMPAGGLVVDVSSVKGRVFAALEPFFPSIDLLIVHPMCAPPAELNLGDAALAVNFRYFREPGGKNDRWSQRFLLALGGKTLDVPVLKHDRLMGVLQFDVHSALLLLGESLVASGVSFVEARAVAPPVGASMLDSLERHFRFGSPDIFSWIQEEFRGISDSSDLRHRWLRVRSELFGIQ